MFIPVSIKKSYSIVYHRETKVMYVMSTDAYNFGTFTLLVNEDGTPMVWKGKK